MKTFILFCSICLSLRSAMAQPVNMDFETWSTSSFVIPHPIGWTSLELEPCSQMSNAHQGQYALQISVWYYYTKSVAHQRAPIQYKPSSLDGFYIYTDNIDAILLYATNDTITDTATVKVFLTHWDTALQQRDTVGRGAVNLNNALNYTAFSCAIHYTNAAASVDSISILISPSLIKGASGDGLHGITTHTMTGYCSFLTIDQLELRQQPTGIPEAEAGKTLQLFPNPAGNQLSIRLPGEGHYRATVYDVSGRRLLQREISNTENTIPVADLVPGVYQVQLTDLQHNFICEGKFVKQ